MQDCADAEVLSASKGASLGTQQIVLQNRAIPWELATGKSMQRKIVYLNHILTVEDGFTTDWVAEVDG
jgi:hypothetical protein